MSFNEPRERPSMTNISLGQLASQYAEHGWPVFPLVPGGKTPATSNGFYGSSTDPAQVRYMVGPRSNYALRMGQGRFALDIDIVSKGGKVQHGAESLARMEEMHGELPPTWEQTTPSGGRHLVFAVPAGLEIPCRIGLDDGSQDYPGIDVRGDGGYIVGPESILDKYDKCHGGRYERVDEDEHGFVCAMAPDWLLRIVARKPLAPSQSPPETMGGLALVSPETYDELADALTAIPAEKEHWVLASMALAGLADLDRAFEIFDEWSKTNPASYDLAANVKRFQNMRAVGRRERNYQSIFHTALELGWQPAKPDAWWIPREPIEVDLGIEEEMRERVLAAGALPELDPIFWEGVEGPLLEYVDWVGRCAYRPLPVAAVSSGLAMVSGVMQRRMIGVWGTINVSPSIYLLTIARPGAGKDIPQKCLASVLGDGLTPDTPFHRNALYRALLMHEGRLVVAVDEADGLVRQWFDPRSNGGVEPYLRQLATVEGGKLYPPQVGARNEERATATAELWDAGIQRPAMTLWLVGTPTVWSAFTDRAVDGGLLARMMVMPGVGDWADLRMPTSSPDHVPLRVEAWVDACEAIEMMDLQGRYKMEEFRVDDRRPVMPPKLLVPFTPEATAYLEQQDAAITLEANRHAAEGRTLRGNLAIRRLQMASRVALLLAAGGSDDPHAARVEIRHVKAALALTEWSEAMMEQNVVLTQPQRPSVDESVAVFRKALLARLGQAFARQDEDGTWWVSRSRVLEHYSARKSGVREHVERIERQLQGDGELKVRKSPKGIAYSLTGFEREP